MFGKRKKKKRRKAAGNTLTTRSPAADPAIDEIRRRDLTTRTYALRADSYDEATHSVEAILTTENRVRVFDLNTWEMVSEILRMDGLALPDIGQVPLLDTHDRSTIFKQLGSTRNLRVEGDKLVGRRYFDSTEEGRKAETKVAEGHVTDGSIGYQILTSVMIDAGKSAEINGATYTAGPADNLRVVTQWTLKEDSLCPIGADGAAKNRDESRTPNKKESNMDPKFAEWLISRGWNPDAINDIEADKLKSLRTEYDASLTPADPVVPDEVRTDTPTESQRGEPTGEIADQVRSAVQAEMAARHTAETERVASIRAIAADGDGDAVTEAIETAVRTGVTVDQARQAVLEAVRQNRPNITSVPGVHIRGEATADELSAGLLIRSSVFDDDEAFVRAVGEEAANNGDRYRDINTLDLCRMAIVMAGRNIPSGREDTIRAAFSTSSLPKILGNTARLSLLRGYTTVRDTWSSWCNFGSVANFQQVTRARLTDAGELELVNNNGEVDFSNVVEEYEQFNISTYARNTAFTRKNIINDDLGVLTRQQVRDGRKARLKIAKLVYVHLLANGTMGDGTALFHADHSNYAAGLALSSANLGAAIQKFRKQTDKAGEPIDIEPAILLVPSELEVTAKELLQSDLNIYGGNTKIPAKNIFKGLLKPEVEPRLANSNYTGYSTTGYYIIADPASADTIEVAFLNGVQTPTLETFNPGADRMGIIFRVYQDVGVKSLDWRTMVRQTA